MARFLTLSSFTGFFLVVAGWFGSTSSRADTPMTMVPAPTTAPASTTPSSAPGKPPVSAPVLPPQDTLNRYGSILIPGDEAAHPLRLHMPFPGVGEVKIPNAGELAMREKLEQLASLSDDEIHAQLEKWPAFSKMSLRDQGAMLMRIQDFRDYRTRTAQQKAHDMGLLTLTADQQKKFEKDYWDKRLQMDRDLAKQFDSIYRDRDQKFKDELYREFSATSGVPIVPGPKPPVPPAPKTAPPTVGVNKAAPAPMPAKNESTASTATEPMMMQQK